MAKEKLKKPRMVFLDAKNRAKRAVKYAKMVIERPFAERNVFF